jgi:hypothetical protein
MFPAVKMLVREEGPEQAFKNYHDADERLRQRHRNLGGFGGKFSRRGLLKRDAGSQMAEPYAGSICCIPSQARVSGFRRATRNAERVIVYDLGRSPDQAAQRGNASDARELNHLGPFVDVFDNELVLSLSAALGASSFSRAPGVEINCMTCAISSCTP